jgi:hypothetical protein
MGIAADSVTPDKPSGSGEVRNESTQKPTQFSNSGYDVFHSLLLEWGFTGTQLLLVNDALREAGLEITTRDAKVHLSAK